MRFILKNLYKFFCVGVLLLANVATFANVTTESEAKINDQSHLVTVDFYNGAAILTNVVADQNNNDSYIETDTILSGQSSNGWKLPVGSYFCVLNNGFLDRFLVVGTPSKPDLDNNVSLRGTVFYTWYNEGYEHPGLKYVGNVKSYHDGTLDRCATGH
jgi:hypothetical protein